MPIRAICPTCEQAGNVPDNALGKRATCPRCGDKFVVKKTADPVEPLATVQAVDDLESYPFPLPPAHNAVPVVSPPAPLFERPRQSEVPHQIHLILTIFTCFFWTPIWLIHILIEELMKYPCPSCGKWRAEVYQSSAVVDRKECYGLVDRHGTATSVGSFFGTSSFGSILPNASHSGITTNSGNSTWKERAPVIQTTREHFYSCRYCNARWHDYTVKQVEDFERS